MKLRPMTVADAKFAADLTIRAPEAAGWTEADYAELLNHPESGTGFGFVLEWADGNSPVPAGFLIGRVIADEAEILNLAVEPDMRHRGAGRALVREVILYAVARGVKYLFLEVRAGNIAARRLYAGEQFQSVARRPGYYQNPPEDALVLRRELS